LLRRRSGAYRKRQEMLKRRATPATDPSSREKKEKSRCSSFRKASLSAISWPTPSPCSCSFSGSGSSSSIAAAKARRLGTQLGFGIETDEVRKLGEWKFWIGLEDRMSSL